MKKRRSSNSMSKGAWKKNWHVIPCINCVEPTKAPTDIIKILCSRCVAEDALAGFSALTGKTYKNFRMASRYLALTSKKKLTGSTADPTSSKQDVAAPIKTFGVWIKRHREKGDL